MALLFFPESKRAWQQVTDIFDFIWPTAAAMWNLRWQVAGYKNIRPNASSEELSNRFIIGSGINSANLQKSCIESTWEEQQEQFGAFLLINLFAIYESWLDDLFNTIELQDEDLKMKFQFPTGGMKKNLSKGILNAIKTVSTPESVMLKNSFYHVFTGNNKYSINNLDDLLICYRYFKECRNSIIHSGGTAGDRAEKAYRMFKSSIAQGKLGLKEVPEHYPLTCGDKVKLSLRGVVGFSEVILKIIATIDAELLISARSEPVFLSICKDWLNKNKGRIITLKTKDEKKMNIQLSRIVVKFGFPKPKVNDDLKRYLKRNKLVG